jgi:peroxiredoxin
MSNTEPRTANPGFEVEIQSGGRAHDSAILTERAAPVLSPARAAAKASSQRRTRLLLILGGVFIASLIAYLWLANPNSSIPAGAVARVNGEYIFQADIEREINLTRVSNELGNANSEIPSAASVLEELINRKMQTQDARKAGIEVASEEVDNALKDVFGRTGITAQRLDEALRKNNLRLDDMRLIIADTIAINKYVATVVVKDAKSQEEARNLQNDWQTNLALTSRVDRLQAVGSGPAPRTNALAPDFTLTNLDGKQVKLSDLKGQPVMINFWATWCPPCRAEIPVLTQMYKETHADGAYEILGIATQSDEQTISAFAREFDMLFPVMPDAGSQVTSLYHVLPIPTTFFIDKDGIIRFIKSGPVDRPLMEKYLLGK